MDSDLDIEFQENDISLETQWRSLILFGRNSATYKFAFAKSLLDAINKEKTKVSLKDLAVPFSKCIADHLLISDKQGNSKSSKFLDYCRSYNNGQLPLDKLHDYTEKFGFVNVVDAFQNINGGKINDPFYEKNYNGKTKEIIITDNLLQLKENFHFNSFENEVEARWNLVETAWNINVNPRLLEVKYDKKGSIFYIENNLNRRRDITSVRDALNGYQKGKCFYSFQNISIEKSSENICHVDHFLPHRNKKNHYKEGANLDGVWNLVLINNDVHNSKGTKVPNLKFLKRLYNRNEFYIKSKHPLSETIINQTGNNKYKRRDFLQKHYDIAYGIELKKWKPEIELPGTF